MQQLFQQVKWRCLFGSQSAVFSNIAFLYCLFQAPHYPGGLSVSSPEGTMKYENPRLRVRGTHGVLGPAAHWLWHPGQVHSPLFLRIRAYAPCSLKSLLIWHCRSLWEQGGFLNPSPTPPTWPPPPHLQEQSLSPPLLSSSLSMGPLGLQTPCFQLHS